MSSVLYAKIHARLLEDPRVHAAASELGAALRIPEDFAVVSVLGLLAAVDNWLVARGREGESGLLVGDGYATIRQSAMLSPANARAAVSALVTAGLLRVHGDGTAERVGFGEDYSDLIGSREYSRNRRAGKGKGRPSGRRKKSPTRRRPVADPSPTGHPADGDPRSETSEPLTSTASASGDSRTAVASSPPVDQGGEAAATAPGGEPAKACAFACLDGLLPAKGKAKARCCLCPRGRERARAMARCKAEEDAQADRAADARRDPGRRQGGVSRLSDLLPAAMVRAGPGEPEASVRGR